MLFGRKQSRDSRKIPVKLLTIVISQYAILVFSGLASTAAIYLLLSSVSPFFIASNVAMLTATGCSILHLLLHQCGAWKYSRFAIKPSSEKIGGLFAWASVLNIFALFVWIAAAVLGLMILSDSPSCVPGPATRVYEYGWSHNNCKVQKAGVATTLVAMIFSVMALCMSALAKHPFAASLAGVHLHEHHRDVTLYLSTASWPNAKFPDIRPSFDTSIYTPSFQGPFVSHEEWLPNLSSVPPAQQSNQGYKPSLDETQLLKHKESNLLPSPIMTPSPQELRLLQSEKSQPPLKRSATIQTVTSSVYSQSDETQSSIWKHASTKSSLSDDSRTCSFAHSSPPPARILPRKPSIPSIPPQFCALPVTTTSQKKKKSSAPSNLRPHVSPATFRKEAQSERQKYNLFMEPNAPSVSPLAQSRRHTEYLPDYSRNNGHPSNVQPSSERSIAKSELNRKHPVDGGNVEQRSHDSQRKGRSIDISVIQAWI